MKGDGDPKEYARRFGVMLGSCSLLVEPDRSYPSQKGKLRTPNWRIVLLFVIVVTIAAIFVFPASLSKTCHVLSKGLLVSNTHNYVPKVIWQTYKTKQLPKEAAQASQTCKLTTVLRSWLSSPIPCDRVVAEVKI